MIAAPNGLDLGKLGRSVLRHYKTAVRHSVVEMGAFVEIFVAAVGKSEKVRKLSRKIF